MVLINRMEQNYNCSYYDDQDPYVIDIAYIAKSG